jgi:hypothetical protein
LKLAEWGASRRELLFKICDSLIKTLMSIFVNFMGVLMDPVLEVLDNVAAGAEPDNMWILALSLLKHTFMFDTIEFTTAERFKRTLIPLVKQLEIQDSSYFALVIDHAAPVIPVLALARHDEVSLKAMNKAVLQATRNEEQHVRKACIAVLHQLYAKLGQEMIPYFPETVPFIAELLEDQDQEVQAACHELCSEIERHLGEPIEHYFQ